MSSVGPLMSQFGLSFAAEEKEGESSRITIFHTFMHDQILLTELGNVIALQAYLNLYQIDFLLDQRINAEDMSPDGVLPFIRSGPNLVSGYDKIIELINKQNNIEYPDSIVSKKAARIVLFTKVFFKAELYYTWLNKDIYTHFTAPRYSYGRPWPITCFINWNKKWDISQKIEDTRNIDLEFENLLEEFSGLLEDKKRFIFGDQPCDLDTLIYGHLKAMIEYREHYHQLYEIIAKFPNLIDYISMIDTLVSHN